MPTKPGPSSFRIIIEHHLMPDDPEASLISSYTESIESGAPLEVRGKHYIRCLASALAVAAHLNKPFGGSIDTLMESFWEAFDEAMDECRSSGGGQDKSLWSQ